MKSSYKIALLIAAGLLVVVVIYYGMQGDGEPTEVATQPTPQSLDDLGKNPWANGDADQPGARTGDERLARRSAPRRAGLNDASDDAPAEDESLSRAASPTGDARSGAGDPSSDAFLDQLRDSVQAAQPDGATTHAAPAATDAADQDAAANRSAAAIAGTEDDGPQGLPASPPDADATDAQAGFDPDRAGANETAGINEARSMSERNSGTTAEGSDASFSESAQAGSPAADLDAAGGLSDAIAVDDPPVPYFGPLPRPAQRPTRAASSSSNNGSSVTRQSTTDGTYTIQAGDTFSSIARDLYGDESRWFDIAQANPTVDPNRLQVGQEIRLPGSERRGSSANAGSTRPTASTREGRVVYTVQVGDTLSRIAGQFYDNPGAWRTIFEANQELLGNDPDNIQAGQELVIPPAPRPAR